MKTTLAILTVVALAWMALLGHAAPATPNPMTNEGSPAVAAPGASSASRAFQDYTDAGAFAAAAGPLTTIAFTEVPVGTVLTNQYPGLTFTDGDDQTLSNSAFVNDGVGVVDGVDSSALMTVVFDQPILAVGVHFPGAARIAVYDVPGGTLLYQSAGFGGSGTGFFGGVVSTVTPFTAVVIVDWFAAPGYYDDLVYGEPVPVELTTFTVE